MKSVLVLRTIIILLMRIAMEIPIIHSIILILISGSSGQIWWSGGNICPDRLFSWFGRKAAQAQHPTVRLHTGRI
jgi:hypothetical protein